MKNLALTPVLLLVLGSVSVAHAEDPNAPPPDQTGTPVMQPTDGQQPVYQDQQQPQPVYQDQQQQPVYQDPQQQPVEVVEEEESAETGRGIQYGAHLVLPIFLADNNTDLDPGIGIGVQGRIGWEFGAGLSVELAIGIMYNPGSSSDPGYTGYGLTDIWLGGGLRYSFLNETAIVPFIGAGLGVNLWSDTFTDAAGVTRSTGQSVPTFGVNGTVGVQIEISPEIGLEGGAQINWTSDPGTDIAVRPTLWLSPFLGGTLYF